LLNACYFEDERYFSSFLLTTIFSIHVFYDWKQFSGEEKKYMQCRVCGAPMPSGAKACSYCGTVVVPAANQQGYGGPVPPPSYAGPYQQPPPSPGQAGYNQPPYQQPPPLPGQAGYNQPPPYQQPGQAGYNQPQPYQQPGQAGYNQQQPYQQPGQAGYSQPSDITTPYQHPGSAFYNRPGLRPQHPGRPGNGLPADKKKTWAILFGIGVLVVILGIVASLVVSSMLHPASNTATTNPVSTSSVHTPVAAASTPTTVATTATVVSTSTPAANTAAPSGNAIDPAAAQIVTNPQTSSDVNSKTLEAPAGTVTTTFKVNGPIYVLFHLDTTKFNAATQKDYVNVRFYTDSKSIVQDDPLQIMAYETVGYFEAKYYTATTAGAAEIYWCHTADCSDGKLAQVLHFTVTG
jgi:hypothetical protein